MVLFLRSDEESADEYYNYLIKLILEKENILKSQNYLDVEGM